MKISINEPCHENWDKMTPNDKGAFCLSCQKNVVDFSNKTISQIKDFFRKKTETELVCGRFDELQLEALNFDDFFTSFKNWKYFRKATLVVFFIFGLSLFSCSQSNQEPMRPKMGAVAYVPRDTTKIIVKKDTTKNTMIKGNVKSNPKKEQKNPNSNKVMGGPMIENKNNK